MAEGRRVGPSRDSTEDSRSTIRSRCDGGRCGNPATAGDLTVGSIEAARTRVRHRLAEMMSGVGLIIIGGCWRLENNGGH